MTAKLNQESLINWYKGYDPSNALGKSDEEIYGLASQWAEKKYGQPLKPYQPKVAPTSTNGMRITPMDNDGNDLSTVGTSPDDIKQVRGLANRIGTFSVAGALADAGIAPEYFGKVYNESLAGQAYQLLNGESKYQIEDYGDEESDWMDYAAEFGGYLIGMVSVPEAAAFMTGARLGIMGGQAAATGLTKYGLMGLKKSAETKLKERALSTAVVSTGLETGIQLGTIGAAYSATASANKQLKENGSISVSQTLKDGAQGFGESFLIGAPAGAVARGYMGSKYAMAKLASDDKALDLSTRAMYGLPTRIGTEALAFTTLPNLYRGLASPFADIYQDYPEFGTKEWNKQFFMDLAMTGIFEASAKKTRDIKGYDDAFLWAQTLLRQANIEVSQISNASKNVEASFADVGVKINPEALNIISKNKELLNISEKDFNTFKSNQETLKKINEKLQKGEKLTDKEIEDFQELNNTTALIELGLLKELDENDSAFRAVLEELQDGPVSDADFNTYKKALTAKMDDTIDFFDDLNEALTGIRSRKKDRVDVDATGTPKTRIVRMVGEVQEMEGGIPIVGQTKTDIKTNVLVGGDQYNDLIKKGYRELIDDAPQTQTQVNPIKDSSSIDDFNRLLEQRGVGYDRLTESKKFEDVIESKRSETFEYEEKKQKKTSSNEKFIKDRKKQMLDVKKDAATNRYDDINAVIAYGLEFQGGKKLYRGYSGSVAKYVNWLHKTKRKSIKDSNADDVHEYLVDVVMASANKNKIGGSDIAPFSNFYKYIHKKLHADGLDVKENISYEQANAQRSTRITGPKDGVDTKLLNKVDSRVDDVISQLEIELGQSSAFKENAVLSKLIKYGIRDQEINLIQKENIKFSDSEGWYIDFGVGSGVPFISKRARGETLATVIPIPERLARQILDLAKPGKKLIFSDKSKIGKVANKKRIAQLVFGKDYDWDLNRTILKTKAVDIGINSEQMSIYMRNNKNIGTEFYTKEQIDNILQRHKEIQQKLGIGGEAKFQLERVGSPESIDILSPWLNEQIRRNPGLKIRKLKDAEFVGRFYEGVIDITMGKANKFTFFHENSHRLKAMIDSSGNKQLKAIWAQGEKLFKNDKNRFYTDINGKKKKRDLEEFMSDELAAYALKREQPASLRAKMKGWMDRMYSTIKQVFFGKDSLNKNDIKNLLGEKVFKGFATSKDLKASSIARFKYANVDELAGGIKRDFDYSLEKANMKLKANEKKALIKYVAQKAGIEEPEAFNISGSMSEADLIAFNDTFKLLPFADMSGVTDIAAKSSVIRSIEQNAPKVMTPEQQKNIMKLLGFKKLTLWGASLKELKSYQEVINGYRGVEQDRLAGIMESSTLSELTDTMAKLDDATLIAGIKTGALPVGQIIRKLGANRIADNMEDHIAVELRHVGEFISFEETAQRIFGESVWGGTLTGTIASKAPGVKGTRLGKGIKDSLYLLDYERYIERKESGLLKGYEDKFFKNAFAPDYLVRNKDGKLVKNKKYNKTNPGYNLNTKEGQLAEAWGKYTKYVKNSFEEAVKANLNEVEYANFKAKNSIKWIEDNVYMSRLLTPEFKRAFPIEGRNFEKLIDEQAAPIAVDLAKKKYKTKNPTQEQIGEMIEDAQDVVKANLYDLFRFGKGRHQTRFLKRRHYKLPEVVEVDGKKIQVYETGYEQTVKPYALGMSKFLANTEIFPEYVKLENFDFGGQKAALQKLAAANPKWGGWIADQVEKQLGYGKNYTDYDSFFSKGLSNTAQVLAKTQLSFPTSGLKNLVLGQTATLQAFRVREWFSAMGRAMSKEFQNEVKRLGATEIGLRHIEDVKSDLTRKGLDKIFKFGGMKPTENINRYVAIAASRIEQGRFAQILRNKKSPKRKIEQAERKLKKFYGLTDDQIALLKKYGMGGVDDVKFPTNYAKAKERRIVQRLYDKMDTMAHVKTQGASLNFYMPKWADEKLIRPLTLFKRMAYASTVNTINNANIAWKNGDMVKLSMVALGPYLAGQALMHVYDWAFDEQPKVENSDQLAYLNHVLIRGEALGVLSDFLRLYEGESAEDTMYPAVYNFFGLAAKSVGGIGSGKITPQQFFEDIGKGTFGMYRGYKKLADNDFHKKKKKYRRLYNEFYEEVFPDKPETFIKERVLNNRSPYYRDFNDAFYNQSVEEFTRHAIIMTYAVATDLFNENVTADGIPTKYANVDEALKQSLSNLKTKLKALNPNPGNFLKSDKKVSLLWLNWLAKDKNKYAEYKKELESLESQYAYKYNQFKRLLPTMVKDPELVKEIRRILGKSK